MSLEKLPVQISGANVIEVPGTLEQGFYLATLEGEVFFVEGGKTPRMFLDLKSMVRTGSERGLLGFVLHPEFRKKGSWGFGRFYVHYSHSEKRQKGADHVAVVSEWRVLGEDFSKVDPRSERVLLEIPQPQGNHNGGDLEFSPGDKFLYVALGDGGAAHDLGSGHTPGLGNAQDLTNFLGKILRIDPSGTPYKIPRDNPFAKATNPAVKKEIFAYGLRNVYRMNFDAGTLWAGDVGQHRWEEVNQIEKGGNYGWGFYEGFVEAERLRAPKPVVSKTPVLVYKNPDQGASVIGGQVYRGERFPQLKGKYIFGDFYKDQLRTIENAKLKELPALRVGQQLSDVARDTEGNLYFCTLEGWIYRL